MTKQIENEYDRLFKETYDLTVDLNPELAGLERGIGTLVDREAELRREARAVFGFKVKIGGRKSDVLYPVTEKRLIDLGEELIRRGGKYKSKLHAANAVRRSLFNIYAKTWIAYFTPDSFLDEALELVWKRESLNSASFIGKNVNQHFRRKIQKEMDYLKIINIKRRYMVDQIKAKAGAAVFGALQDNPSKSNLDKMIVLGTDLFIMLVLATGKSQREAGECVTVKTKPVGLNRVKAAVRRLEKLGFELHKLPSTEDMRSTYRDTEAINLIIEDAIGLRALVNLLHDELTFAEGWEKSSSNDAWFKKLCEDARKERQAVADTWK